MDLLQDYYIKLKVSADSVLITVRAPVGNTISHLEMLTVKSVAIQRRPLLSVSSIDGWNPSSKLSTSDMEAHNVVYPDWFWCGTLSGLDLCEVKRTHCFFLICIQKSAHLCSISLRSSKNTVLWI